jgi:hypothetical protein
MRARTSLIACFLGFMTVAGCMVDRGDPYGRQHPNVSGAGGGSTSYGGSGGVANGGGGSGGSTTSTGGGTLTCAAGTSSDFKVAWTIDDANGGPSSCAGVNALEMDLDLLDLDTNVDSHGIFACTDMGGTSCALPPGPYSFAMRLRDGTGKLISELVSTDTVHIVSGQTTDLGTIPFWSSQGSTGPGQGLGASWTISRQGATVTCDQAGAATLEIDVGDQKFPLTCSDGKGITPPVTPGIYPVTFRLLDAQGNALSVTQTMSVAVPAGKLVDLGTIPFDVL